MVGGFDVSLGIATVGNDVGGVEGLLDSNAVGVADGCNVVDVEGFVEDKNVGDAEDG